MVWDDLASNWKGFRPPLCPHADDVTALARAIAGHDSSVLLLGVTPQLAGLGQRLTAVDHSAEMIARVWPGDSASRMAVKGEWLADMPSDHAFTAVVSDGGLSCLRWPDEYERLFKVLKATCEPGFRLALRCHLADNFGGAVPLDRLAREIAEVPDPDPHAARHRVAHALVLEGADPNIGVAEMADRALLLVSHSPAASAVLKAWPRPPADVRFSFPTRQRVESLLSRNGFTVAPAPALPGLVIADAD